MKFTAQQVIHEATRLYGKPVSTDSITDALNEPTLEDAVGLVLLDTSAKTDQRADPYEIMFAPAPASKRRKK